MAHKFRYQKAVNHKAKQVHNLPSEQDNVNGEKKFPRLNSQFITLINEDRTSQKSHCVNMTKTKSPVLGNNVCMYGESQEAYQHTACANW